MNIYLVSDANDEYKFINKKNAVNFICNKLSHKKTKKEVKAFLKRCEDDWDSVDCQEFDWWSINEYDDEDDWKDD